MDLPLELEFAAEEYDSLLNSLVKRLTASAITIPASGRFWRKTNEEVVIRI